MEISIKRLRENKRRVDGFLNDMLSAPEQERHRDDEIRRNALVIFFGGISTVEALYEAAGEFRPERRQIPPHHGFATGPQCVLAGTWRNLKQVQQ